MRVLYLFAGIRRKSDLGSRIRQQGRLRGITVVVDEVDVLRDQKKHNLLSAKRKRHYLQYIKLGKYDAVVASPP